MTTHPPRGAGPGRLAGLLAANPMINKELRGRMRSGRSVVVLTIYLILLALFCLLFYWLLDSTAASRGPYNQQIGRDLLYAIVIFETLLVVFLAPAFTVGAISGERERQTFDLLMTTLLKPRSVVLGKMGAALAFLGLLILAVAPLESLAFMFGGVSPEEIAGSLIVLLFAALLYGSVGLFWSSLMRSTVAATVLTYGTLLLVLLGVPFIWFVASLGLSSGLGGQGITQSEPFFYISGLLLSTNPIIALSFSESFLRNGKPLFVFTDTNILNGKQVLIVNPWLLYCLIALVVSILLLWLSSRMLPPVRRRAAPVLPVVAAPGDLPPLPQAPVPAAIVGGPAPPAPGPISGYPVAPHRAPAPGPAPAADSPADPSRADTEGRM